MSDARPTRTSRLFLALNFGALFVTIGAWLALQLAVRHDGTSKQAGYGFIGCYGAPKYEPWLDWHLGSRRLVLRAAVAKAAWLWPLASGEDVRRGAEQLLIESASGDDATDVAEAVEQGQLDPAFGALHFALSWSERHDSLPAFLGEWLDGAPHQQLFATVALTMLTGTRDERLEAHHYEPLPLDGDATAVTASLEATAQTLFQTPLADAVAAWRADVADASQRPRGEIVALLAICPRQWSLF